jgi:hypothetical protein
MRSFSREERGQAKQSHLLQAKLKPQATLWTPSTSLASPSWMKTVKRGSFTQAVSFSYCRPSSNLARSLHSTTQRAVGL